LILEQLNLDNRRLLNENKKLSNETVNYRKEIEKIEQELLIERRKLMDEPTSKGIWKIKKERKKEKITTTKTAGVKYAEEEDLIEKLKSDLEVSRARCLELEKKIRTILRREARNRTTRP